ncbi:Uncharacterized protein Fot_12129 [Forsythia ovata]|uniref:Uncharacterized protein n=1 Tax=Forsythia ovata TaxID=205694 RepID=A0ABD1WLN8_9LAMI
MENGALPNQKAMRRKKATVKRKRATVKLKKLEEIFESSHRTKEIVEKDEAQKKVIKYVTVELNPKIESNTGDISSPPPPSSPAKSTTMTDTCKAWDHYSFLGVRAKDCKEGFEDLEG